MNVSSMYQKISYILRREITSHQGQIMGRFGAARNIVDISASRKVPVQTIKVTGFNN